MTHLTQYDRDMIRLGLDPFAWAYVECMLWSSTDGQDEPLDREHWAGDLSDEALATVRDDCRLFCEQAEDRLETEEDRLEFQRREERAGHDFWLSRARLGAGFCGSWGRTMGNLLTDVAQEFAEQDPYVGDDGRIHLQ